MFNESSKQLYNPLIWVNINYLVRYLTSKFRIIFICARTSFQTSMHSVRKGTAAEEGELSRMKKQILLMFPDMESALEKMSKENLEEVLQLALADQNPQIPRAQMVKEILAVFPDMASEIEVLDYNDTLEIYNQLVNQAKADDSDSQRLRKQARQRCQFDGEEINVYEMKKTLIERLPEFRVDIRKMPDQQIRTIFQDLLREENEKAKSYMKGHQFHKKQYPASIREYSPRPQQIAPFQSQIYSQAKGYLSHNPGYRTIPQKQPTAQDMYHRQPMVWNESDALAGSPQAYDQISDIRCKITFYLGEEDFMEKEGERSAADRQNSLLRSVQQLASTPSRKYTVSYDR